MTFDGWRHCEPEAYARASQPKEGIEVYLKIGSKPILLRYEPYKQSYRCNLSDHGMYKSAHAL